jgi:nucleoside-diphosphate-sugar epimerase
LARGIRLAIESPAALNTDFNLSTAEQTNVLQLAEKIWRRAHGSEPLRVVHDKPYPYDVKLRVPSVEKAKAILGFEAKTTLDEALDEIIPWVQKQIELGTI